jgi:hypothetical protein
MDEGLEDEMYEEYERAEAEAARKAQQGELLAVEVDGTTRMVRCAYGGIRDGLNGATLSFLRGTNGAGLYIDDNGMITGQVLNIPASLMFGHPLYGPVVLTAAEPDEFGNTLPSSPEAVDTLRHLALAWRHVVINAASVGQDVYVTADADTVPEPRVVALSDDEFAKWMETGELP